jgi:thioredoxin 1
MKKILFALIVFVVVSCNAQTNQQLQPKELQLLIQSKNPPVLLDVRSLDEFSRGYLTGAVNIDYNSEAFESDIMKLDKLKPYVVYCLSGGRSSDAAAYMRSNGFKKVLELKGGVMAWEKAGLTLSFEPLVEITKQSLHAMDMNAFEKLMKQDKTVLIDFYAPWCGPCRKMEPALASVTEKFRGKATIVRINIDENKALARQLGVDEIPYLMLYKNGEKKGNFIGAMDEKGLISILEKATVIE